MYMCLHMHKMYVKVYFVAFSSSRAYCSNDQAWTVMRKLWVEVVVCRAEMNGGIILGSTRFNDAVRK